MKRILCVLAACLLVFGIISCSPAEKTDTVQVTSVPIPMPEQTKDAETTPEPEPYTPMDLFGIEFNPYADTEFPDNFTVLYASFNKGSRKLEGKNPFILSLSADGNMYAAVAYLADVSGLSEQEKNDRFDDYSKIGFCEFTGTDGTTILTTRMQYGNASPKR